MRSLWEAAWKVVIHCKKPGVHQFPQELRTFQTVSRKSDTHYVANDE